MLYFDYLLPGRVLKRGLIVSKHEMLSRVENGKELVLERVFDAPREWVFKFFKEPEYLKHWWGVRGWELPVCNIDFRPGGVWHYCMKCTDPDQETYGMESWNKSIYKEIVEPEKVVYMDYFSDEEGQINEAMPAPEVTMEFIDLGQQTKLISRSVYDTEEALQTVLAMGVLEGISQTWDRLDELVDTFNEKGKLN